MLDLGCGLGATVNYLYEKHQIRAVGIDPSVKLISAARKAYTHGEFFSRQRRSVALSGEQLRLCIR